eukprot:sb/3466857/
MALPIRIPLGAVAWQQEGLQDVPDVIHYLLPLALPFQCWMVGVVPWTAFQCELSAPEGDIKITSRYRLIEMIMSCEATANYCIQSLGLNHRGLNHRGAISERINFNRYRKLTVFDPDLVTKNHSPDDVTKSGSDCDGGGGPGRDPCELSAPEGDIKITSRYRLIEMIMSCEATVNYCIQSDPDLVAPDLVAPRFSERINFNRYRKLTVFDPDLVTKNHSPDDVTKSGSDWNLFISPVFCRYIVVQRPTDTIFKHHMFKDRLALLTKLAPPFQTSALHIARKFKPQLLLVVAECSNDQWFLNRRNAPKIDYNINLNGIED